MQPGVNTSCNKIYLLDDLLLSLPASINDNIVNVFPSPMSSAVEYDHI